MVKFILFRARYFEDTSNFRPGARWRCFIGSVSEMVNVCNYDVQSYPQRPLPHGLGMSLVYHHPR